MGLGGIAQLIDALYGGIQGGIKADGVFGGGDIVIDGAGQPDGGDAERRELLCAAEGAVAADDDQTVNAAGTQNLHRLFLSLLGGEFLAAGGIQDGAAPVNDVADGAFLQLVHPVLHQSLVSVKNAVDGVALMQGGAHHAADGRIHAGGVAAAGKNCKGFLLGFAHVCFLLYRFRL